MPVDWEKVERLRVERYGDGRLGQPGVRAFADNAGLTPEQYRYHLELARGKRPAGKTGRVGIPLSYVEGIAQSLEVPLSEILDGETRSAEFERGLRNGRLQALAEMHHTLNEMMRGEA